MDIYRECVDALSPMVFPIWPLHNKTLPSKYAGSVTFFSSVRSLIYNWAIDIVTIYKIASEMPIPHSPYQVSTSHT